MTSTLFSLPRSMVFTPNGDPAVGATATFYVTGTTTLAPIYSDSTLTTPLPNPITANSAGVLPTVYINATITYRVVVKDALGITMTDIDPYNVPAPAPPPPPPPPPPATQFGLFTELRATPPAIDASIYLIETSGYSRQGIGAAHYLADIGINGTGATINYATNFPRAAFTAADGRIFRLYEPAYDIEMFGGLRELIDRNPGNPPDIADAWDAAMAYMYQLNAEPIWQRDQAFGPSVSPIDAHMLYGGEATELRFRSGYYSTRTLAITTPCIIKGYSSGHNEYLHPSHIRFADNIGGVTVAPLSYSPIIDGVTFLGNWTPGHAKTDALSGCVMSGPCEIRNSRFKWFGGHGVCIKADVYGIGNGANLWFIERCSFMRNGLSGLYVIGGDSNAGYCSMTNCSQNGRWGFEDKSFLGNTYIACHASDNGGAQQQTVGSWHGSFRGYNTATETNIVTYGGKIYALRYSNEANAQSTIPGTDANVWIEAPDAIHGIPWSGTGSVSYHCGGPYAMAGDQASNLCLNCYAEGGQAPSYTGHGMFLLGFVNATAYGFGSHINPQSIVIRETAFGYTNETNGQRWCWQDTLPDNITNYNESFKVGDKAWKRTNTAGGTLGWVCITAGQFNTGTPPTFKTFGSIAA